MWTKLHDGHTTSPVSMKCFVGMKMADGGYAHYTHTDSIPVCPVAGAQRACANTALVSSTTGVRTPSPAARHPRCGHANSPVSRISQDGRTAPTLMTPVAKISSRRRANRTYMTPTAAHGHVVTNTAPDAGGMHCMQVGSAVRPRARVLRDAQMDSICQTSPPDTVQCRKVDSAPPSPVAESRPVDSAPPSPPPEGRPVDSAPPSPAPEGHRADVAPPSPVVEVPQDPRVGAAAPIAKLIMYAEPDTTWRFPHSAPGKRRYREPISVSPFNSVSKETHRKAASVSPLGFTLQHRQASPLGHTGTNDARWKASSVPPLGFTGPDYRKASSVSPRANTCSKHAHMRPIRDSPVARVSKRARETDFPPQPWSQSRNGARFVEHVEDIIEYYYDETLYPDGPPDHLLKRAAELMALDGDVKFDCFVDAHGQPVEVLTSTISSHPMDNLPKVTYRQRFGPRPRSPGPHWPNISQPYGSVQP